MRLKLIERRSRTDCAYYIAIPYRTFVISHTLKKKYCAYNNTKLTIRRDVVRKISKVTREKRLGILPKQSIVLTGQTQFSCKSKIRA